MLIDFQNEGYITICPQSNLVPVQDKNTYIPTNTWGFIKGDISEQEDLMSLLTTIESGLTVEQIKLLVDTDERFIVIDKDILNLDKKLSGEIDNVEASVNELSKQHANEITYNILPAITANTTALKNKVDRYEVYTKSEIDSKMYATESWVTQQGYIKEHQSLDGYYTKSEVDATLTTVGNNINNLTIEIDNVEASVNELSKQHANEITYNILPAITANTNALKNKANVYEVYTKVEIDNKGYLTEQSLDNYYTKDEVDGVISNIDVDLTGYATESWVTQQGYLTEHQNLDNYYTKSEVDSVLERKVDYSKIWTGTQTQWDAMSVEEQNSYIIAMVEL